MWHDSSTNVLEQSSATVCCDCVCHWYAIVMFSTADRVQQVQPHTLNPSICCRTWIFYTEYSEAMQRPQWSPCLSTWGQGKDMIRSRASAGQFWVEILSILTLCLQMKREDAEALKTALVLHPEAKGLGFMKGKWRGTLRIWYCTMVCASKSLQKAFIHIVPCIVCPGHAVQSKCAYDGTSIHQNVDLRPCRVVNIVLSFSYLCASLLFCYCCDCLAWY